jgi:hypothetical protein
MWEDVYAAIENRHICAFPGGIAVGSQAAKGRLFVVWEHPGLGAHNDYRERRPDSCRDHLSRGPIVQRANVFLPGPFAQCAQL